MSAVVLPLLALAIAAWLVPWALGRLLPEGVAWLAVVAVASAFLLVALSAGGFWWLYGAARGAVAASAPGHFVILAARASLVWAPIMMLSVANLPRGWKVAVW